MSLYAHVDPITTIDDLWSAFGIREGAIVRYVLAKWASGGSGGLLELGPSMVNQLWELEQAEAAGTDAARLDAYEQLRQVLSWVRLPLADPDAGGY